MKGRRRGQIPVLIQLPKRLLVVKKRLYYYCALSSDLLAAASALVCLGSCLALIIITDIWFQNYAAWLFIGSGVLVGFFSYLQLLASNLYQRAARVSLSGDSIIIEEDSPTDIYIADDDDIVIDSYSLSNDDNEIIDDHSTNDRTINVGGNYNESVGNYVEGDSITYIINESSDVSEAATLLKELLTQLQEQGLSQADAQQKVANELVQKAQSDSDAMSKLFEWRNSLGNSTTGSTVTTAATDVVEFAANSRNSSADNLGSAVGVNYQKLRNLLKARKWREADEETAIIMFRIAGLETSDYYFYGAVYDLAGEIAVFRGEALRTINDLWVEYSKGRFGFSVQKRIWKEVKGDLDAFGDRVGWRVDGCWLYYSDFHFSIKAPQGHFPVRVMLGNLYNRCNDYGMLYLLNALAARRYYF